MAKKKTIDIETVEGMYDRALPMIIQSLLDLATKGDIDAARELRLTILDPMRARGMTEEETPDSILTALKSIPSKHRRPISDTVFGPKSNSN